MDYGKLLGIYNKLIAQCNDPLELQRLEKEKEEIAVYIERRDFWWVDKKDPLKLRGASNGALVIC